MDNEVILMHMTQVDLALKNIDRLMLCHFKVTAEEMSFHRAMQGAVKDERATGMGPVLSDKDAGCTLHPLIKRITKTP